jgi:hypothetical protein
MRIYFTLLFVSCISFGFTQAINANYIHADSAKYYISVYLNIHDLNRSNYEVKDQYADLPDISTLKELKFKKTRNGFEFFAFKKTYSKVWYNKKCQSLIGDLLSINTSDGDILVAMKGENGNFIRIRISQNVNHEISATITEISKNGKVKVYFSEKCELNRYSI